MLIQGNSIKIPLADNSVHSVITSPPYFALRDYGIENQIGLEPTIAAYVAVMVQVFREVKRVLHPSGVCFVNLGDTYATGKNGRSAADTKAVGRDDRTFRDKPFSVGGGKPTRYKLRQNLTNEEMIYVLEELSKARAISEETQEGRE